MRRPSIATARRPGLRLAVLSISAGVIVVATLAVSANVSDHLAQTATDEAVRSTAAIIRTYVDPMVSEGSFAGLTRGERSAIDGELTRLVASSQILRIKIWAPDGTVVDSDLAVLRGRRFPLSDELSRALNGETATDYSSASKDENVFERGLADRFLEIYLPITDAQGEVVGAYEIYEDAAPIEAQITGTRQDVLVIVGAMSLGLFILLWLAFGGVSRRLDRQNRLLRERAAHEQLLMSDLRRSEERFRSLVQNSADIIMVLRADGTIAYESPAVERVLGYPVDGRSGRSALELIHPDDVSWGEQLLVDVTRTAGAQLTGEFRARHADGSWRSVEAVATNLLDEPAVGGIVINYHDVTERKRLEEELKHRAFHDSLTGLANRALFADRLDHALLRARRSRRPLAVLFLDVDDFKTINDSLGHGEGDQLLIAVAVRLRGTLRAGDTVARLGGDEFAVLLEDPPESAAPVEVAARLLASLEAPFVVAGKELFVRGSVGVATTRSRGQTAEEVLRNADAAMYMAKSNGKNRVEVFEPGMHTAALARLALKVDLERALERNEFALAYQPILELGTGRVSGVEALLRWHHPTRGVVMPADFIGVAEETGLIVPLGRWVLEQACRQAVEWDGTFGAPSLTMSVNVSVRQVQDGVLVSDVAGALGDTGLAPERLLLEFTESVLMQDTESTATILSRLKDLGVRLAIDDFGTGYSSLSYLRRLPIDVVKIDRSFVAAMRHGPEQQAVVRSIVSLSETLHLGTIAEGIEEAGQLADLKRLGADQGQGYYFARPLSAEDLSQFVSSVRERARLAARHMAKAS